MLFRSFIFLAASAALALAEDRAPVEPKSLPAPDQPVAPVKPSVEKIDETHFRIDTITFDQKTREIRFPGKVNMIEGLLEFLLVHENGKVHESLLMTAISPTQLNLAFTLLRYPPSRELYPLPNDHGGASNDFPEVPSDVKAAARIAIDVEWKEDGKVRRFPANELIQHTVKNTSMPAGPWVYGGSEFSDGKYAPETSGDIMAIFLTNSALILYPGRDDDNDDVWTPYPKRVPATGTDVTIIITPFSKDKPIPKP
ncbi:MAG: YdjY domain-containing protein [Luteolibacter sp.]